MLGPPRVIGLLAASLWPKVRRAEEARCVRYAFASLDLTIPRELFAIALSYLLQVGTAPLSAFEFPSLISLSPHLSHACAGLYDPEVDSGI